MALQALKQQLNGFLLSLYGEGTLSRHFEQLQELQEANQPGFVAEMLTSYCEQSESIIENLRQLVDRPNGDYSGMKVLAIKLKGSSFSVGAQLVGLACTELFEACQANDYDRCTRAVNRISHDFNNTRGKFFTVAQLERSILACRNSP